MRQRGTISSLHRTCQVEKYAAVIVTEIGQIVGEVREVVANSKLEVIADVAGNRRQCTALALVQVGYIELPGLDQGFPVLEEPVIGTKDVQARVVVEEHRVVTIDSQDNARQPWRGIPQTFHSRSSR